MRILGVDNVMLAVGDADQARRFYVEGLGLKIKFEVASAGIFGLAIGNEEPGLVIRRDGGLGPRPPAASPRIWLEVPDARAAADELRTQGLPTLAPAFQVFTGWTVELADRWGNVFGLTDYTSQPERARQH